MIHLLLEVIWRNFLMETFRETVCLWLVIFYIIIQPAPFSSSPTDSSHKLTMPRPKSILFSREGQFIQLLLLYCSSQKGIKKWFCSFIILYITGKNSNPKSCFILFLDQKGIFEITFLDLPTFDFLFFNELLTCVRHYTKSRF